MICRMKNTLIVYFVFTIVSTLYQITVEGFTNGRKETTTFSPLLQTGRFYNGLYPARLIIPAGYPRVGGYFPGYPSGGYPGVYPGVGGVQPGTGLYPGESGSDPNDVDNDIGVYPGIGGVQPGKRLYPGKGGSDEDIAPNDVDNDIGVDAEKIPGGVPVNNEVEVINVPRTNQEGSPGDGFPSGGYPGGGNPGGRYPGGGYPGSGYPGTYPGIGYPGGYPGYYPGVYGR